MSFFSHVIVPRLCDFLLSKSLLVRHRREQLAGAYGDVLEIGFGTGLNLPYYPEQVQKLTAIDPNPGMHRLAQKRINQRGIEVDQHVLKSELLPIQDSRFDCAVIPSRRRPAAIAGPTLGMSSRRTASRLRLDSSEDFRFMATPSPSARTGRP
jgi:hypothetical protein